MKPMNNFSKTIALFLGLTLLVTAGFTQRRESREYDPEYQSQSDTTEINWGKRTMIIITDEDGKRVELKKNREYEEDKWEDNSSHNDNDEESTPRRRKKSDVDFLALDLGISNYYVDGVFGTQAASPELAVPDVRPGAHVALHFLPTTVSLIGRGVNLKTAITVDWNNYYFQHDLTMLDRQDAVIFDSTGINFSKNKLTTRYAQIPLMLNIDTDPNGNDGVSISFGVYGGILWQAWTKQVSEEMGKVKAKGTYNLNPIKYGLMARVDFKWFDVYANYNLSTLFADGKEPATQTIVAGINILDF